MGEETFWTIENKMHRLTITGIDQRPVACCVRSYVVLTHQKCQSLLEAFKDGDLKAIYKSLMKIWIHNHHHIYQDRNDNNDDKEKKENDDRESSVRLLSELFLSLSPRILQEIIVPYEQALILKKEKGE